MATPTPTYWGYSSDPLINATTNGFVWILGPDKSIDWAVSGGFAGEFWWDPAAVANQANVLLATFSYYADVRFNFVGYYSDPIAAKVAGSELTLTLSASAAVFPSTQTWARAFFPEPDYLATHYVGEAGDVYLNVNSQANNLVSYAPGSAGWFVFMHEVGHALGLKHPHDGGGSGRPTLSQLGLASLDDDWATMMSYNDDFNFNLRQWDPATPMILDVLALQYLYGPNMTTNLGDSVYSLIRTNLYLTFWDAGGNDTVDASAATDGWYIQLPNMYPSSAVPTAVGAAAPLRDFLLPAPTTLDWLAGDIENARGSDFADIIIGSAGHNRIQGGGGNDVLNGGGGNDLIDGGDGIDTAIYSGTVSEYTLQRSSATSVVLSGPDGIDTLDNVERLEVGATQVAIDIQGHAGQAYRLYKAAFDRTPDVGGLGYQMHDLDVGFSLSQVAANFIASPEFQRTYGNVSNTQFITLLYQNVLNRAPDTGGLQFHLNEISAGESRADVLTHFSESPENQANVIGQIQYGMVYVWPA